MAVGKLGSLVTTNPKPVGVFTSTDFKSVSVYVNNLTNKSAKYSVGVSTDASTIEEKEYLYNLNPIGPLEVIEVTDFYIDAGQTLVVQSSIPDVSFTVIASDSTSTTGYGRSDCLSITESTKGLNQTLTTPTRDILYTVGINNQSHESAKVYVGVADSAGNLNNGWIIFGQTLTAASGNFVISDLYVGGNQSIVVKSSVANVNFTSLAKLPSTSGNFVDLNVTGKITASATDNVIPFLYATWDQLPTATTYHGAFAHVHARNKAYFAHSANWWELVNKELDGTIGVGTEQVNVGILTATNVTATNFIGIGTRLSGITSVTPGQYGNATVVPQVTIDNSGRISDITNVLISGGGGGGTEIIIFNDDSLVGTAGTINFGDGIDVTNVSSGVVTVTAAAGVAQTAEVRTNTLQVSGVSTLGVTSTTDFKAQQLNVSGVSTFSGITTVSGQTLFTNQLSASGVVTATSYVGSAANMTSLTGVSAGIYGDSTNVAQVTVDSNGRITGISEVTIVGGGGTSGYGNADVDAHLNTSSASSGEVLSWTGSDYDWVASGGTTSRGTVSGSTGVIGAGTTANITITGYKSYHLLKVDLNYAAWVRLYTDSASRTLDATRPYTTDPDPGSGVIAEVRTTGAGSSTLIMSPAVVGWNNDGTPSTNIYAAVTNNESSSYNISVTLTVIKIED